MTDSDFSVFKERHRDRVAMNPERLRFALEKLTAEGYRVIIVNTDTTQMVVKARSDGSRFVFYAGTGTIQGHPTKRGIRNFIRILKDYDNREKERKC